MYRRCRKESDVEDFVRLRIDNTLEPELLSMKADHFLINRELIRSHRQERLEIGVMNQLTNRYDPVRLPTHRKTDLHFTMIHAK